MKAPISRPRLFFASGVFTSWATFPSIFESVSGTATSCLILPSTTDIWQDTRSGGPRWETPLVYITSSSRAHYPYSYRPAYTPCPRSHPSTSHDTCLRLRIQPSHNRHLMLPRMQANVQGVQDSVLGGQHGEDQGFKHQRGLHSSFNCLEGYV